MKTLEDGGTKELDSFSLDSWNTLVKKLESPMEKLEEESQPKKALQTIPSNSNFNLTPYDLHIEKIKQGFKLPLLSKNVKFSFSKSQKYLNNQDQVLEFFKIFGVVVNHYFEKNSHDSGIIEFKNLKSAILVVRLILNRHTGSSPH